MKQVVSPTTNFAFIIHNTCGLLLLAIGIVLGLNQYFKSSIHCLGRDDISPDYSNAVCMGQTYTVPESLNKKVGIEVPFPGVDKSKPDQSKVYQHNYRWVPYVFIIQSFWFLIVYFIWTHTVHTNSLAGLMFFKDLHSLNRRLHKSFGRNWIFAIKYILLNLMLVIHLSVQISYLDEFVGGKLTLLAKNSGNDSQLVLINFPRVARCAYNHFGSSGDVQKHDSLCVLSMSEVFVKAITFDYYFLFGTRIVAFLSLIYYFFLSLPFLPSLYSQIMPSCRSQALNNLAKKCFVGDWLVVSMVLKAIGVHQFNEMVEQENNETAQKQHEMTDLHTNHNYPQFNE